MINLPTLRQLHYHVTVTETRHFGRAAERCFVTQSTLSAAIRDLEDTLDTVLFERTNRKVLPTPVGLSVARQARELLARTEMLVESVRADADPLSGEVRLGVIPTIGPFVLPRVLKGLRSAYPEMRLFLREDLTQPLLTQLRNGQLDAAFIALPYDVADLCLLYTSPSPRD